MSGSLHTKTCERCGETKPDHDFYTRRNVCKECVKAAVRANYARNRDYYVQYDRDREQTAERKAAKSVAARLHKERHPEKRRARVLVGNAIRNGRLIRQPCCGCGTTENVHAHHHDYSKPLDVEWLCKDCHWRHHNEMKEAI